MNKLTGRVWKYGDNVNTDVIIPARYLNLSTAEELAAHCMEDLDANFLKAAKAWRYRRRRRQLWLRLLA